MDDLQHGTVYDGAAVQVFNWTDGTTPLPILGARLAVDPYSDEPARRIPYVLLEATPDEYTLPLSPAALAAVIAEQRAHLDRLERVVH